MGNATFWEQFINKIRNGYKTKDSVLNNYAQLKAEEDKRRKQQEYALVEKAAEEMKQRQEREFQEKVRRQKQVIPIFRPSKVLHFKGQMNQETLGFIAGQINERKSLNHQVFENQRKAELDSLDMTMKKHQEETRLHKEMIKQQQSDYRGVLDTQSKLSESADLGSSYLSLNKMRLNNRYGQSSLW